MAKQSVLALIRKYHPELDKDSATALVSCKNVYVNGELCTDPSMTYDSQSSIDIVYPKYVSRGGLKLEKALEVFDFDVKGLVFLDAGSSTGGFTDCLLKHGAAFVHCVDVGYNLLDYSLRIDSRVAVHEKTNIMTLTALDPQPDCAVADLSFRSISGAAGRILNLTKRKRMTALIKPQFEVTRDLENFDGVIRDEEVLRQTLLSVYKCLQEEGVSVLDVCASPVHGHKGNKEFLALLTNDGSKGLDCGAFLERAIEH